MIEFAARTTVTSIGDGAFGYCVVLIEVNYLTENPLVADISIFNDETYSSAVLTVAKGGLARAKATEPWCNFTNIVEESEDAIQERSTTNHQSITVYDLHGHRLASPAKGINIINGQKIRFVR